MECGGFDAALVSRRIDTPDKKYCRQETASSRGPAALDENGEAMELLEQAYSNRGLRLRFIKVGYESDGLRKDPRFASLLQKLKSPE